MTSKLPLVLSVMVSGYFVRLKEKAPTFVDAFPNSFTKTYLTAAFSFEPAETLTVFEALIWMVSPVCGLRP